ncbi:MAG TPA: sensor domain-containing diguanylate cyclase [Candidatus Acidoferrum sp.]|nr:sensor domain-containing diguanylate cyclase [Candidatus Acidoferrum sp.]
MQNSFILAPHSSPLSWRRLKIKRSKRLPRFCPSGYVLLDIAQPQRVLAALLESSEDATLSLSPAGTILSWSSGAERLYGFVENEVLGRSLSLLMPLCELSALDSLLKNSRCGDLPPDGTAERLRKDGKKISVSVRRKVVRDDRGEMILIFESGREMNHQDFGGPAEQLMRMIMEQAPVLVWSTDRNLKITSHWGTGLSFSDLRPCELVGRTVSDLFRSEEAAAMPIAQHHKALLGVASRFEFGRGNKALDIQLGPLRSSEGEIIGCMGVGLDITDRKKTEEDIRFQATHDHLTGLANYGVFADTLDREIRRASRTHRPFALLLLDLDGLKTINDCLGHLAGNRALKRLARLMTQHCRSTDLAARYGGDEFALILFEADPGMAEHVAQRIESCLGKDPEPPILSASIGAAHFPSDGRTAQELLEAADRRLYQRKQSGRARGTRAT